MKLTKHSSDAGHEPDGFWIYTVARAEAVQIIHDLTAQLAGCPAAKNPSPVGSYGLRTETEAGNVATTFLVE